MSVQSGEEQSEQSRAEGEYNDDDDDDGWDDGGGAERDRGEDVHKKGEENGARGDRSKRLSVARCSCISLRKVKYLTTH